MKKIRETVFNSVCFAFSIFILLLCLLNSVKLAEVNDFAAELDREAELLKTENEILRAELESSLSIAELEKYAREVLGMQSCSPGQIIYIEHPDSEIFE